MSRNKILTIDELAQKCALFKSKGKIVVHCHGVFDLLHIGHIRYFEQAKTKGDCLIVTLSPDKFVDKGPQRPAFNEEFRAEAIASLSCVDYVAINEWPTAEETLRKIKPNVYVKGAEFKEISSDMTGKIGKEQKVVEEIGAELAFTDDVVFSSTNLINTHISPFSKDVSEYLELFRKRHTPDEVLDVLDRMSDLKVLVIGDVIIDEYVYCEAIGKSSKDPVLALNYQSEDRFAGGILAIANHVSDLAGSVHLLTVLGKDNSCEEFIRENLDDRVEVDFFFKEHSRTLTKRRFLEGYSTTKMLELYFMDNRESSSQLEQEMCDKLDDIISDYDVVLVADFGHGTISPAVRRKISEKASFLALNTQANAGNRGFHTVTTYPRADYICIAEHEMRLEARDTKGPIRAMMDAVIKQMNSSAMVVTQGRKGCVVATGSGEFVSVPSFARQVLDRVGAGDAFLTITALAAFMKVAPEVIGFIGNVVGAEAVEVMGNSKSINRLSIKKHITSLLK